MKKTPKILPHLYKSKGTPIFRDTTALPFANGGIIHFERSEYGSDAREHYDEGGPIYTYSKRPGSFYQRGADGAWMINNSSTGGQYVPIDDPTGQRTALLNKNAVVYNAPAQGAPKPIINQRVWENAAGTSQQNAIAREKQLQTLKMSPVIADQEKAEQIEWERSRAAAAQQAAQDAKWRNEQPLDMMDWLWGAAAIAPVAAPAAWAAAESAGAAALPYIEGALSTSIPGMASIPGATLGNAIGAGFAADAMVNRLPQIPKQISKGQYADAAANVITGGLDIAGGGLVSPLYQGAKSTASELGKVLGTEEGLLSNTYKINPFAGKLGEYNRIVGRDAIDDVFESGLVRVNENAGVASDLGPFGVITRTTPYPSFAKALPQKQYANQVIAQGKQPYIISTDRAMKASTLGRHGKGSTQFPIDETGKYMSGFPASEAKIFEFADKPHWLKGYKEVSRRIISDSKSSTESGKAFKTLYPQAQMMPSGYKTYGQTQYVSPVSVNKNFTWNFDDLKNIKSSEGLPEYMNPYLYSKEIMHKRSSPELDAYYKMKEVEGVADKLIKRKIDDRVYYDLNGNIIKTPSDNY